MWTSCLWALVSAAIVEATIAPKVVIIDFYGDERDSWQAQLNLLEQNITLPGLSVRYPDIHCTGDGSVCQLVTDEGEINAAASTMAFVLSPLFNLTQTYFITAGDGGMSPKVGTLGSVAFAEYAVQVALQYEIDAREKPQNFSTGYIPQGTTSLGSYPQYIYGTEVFRLNDALRQKAIAFAKTASLNDSADAQAYRQLYANNTDFAPALGAPSILACDTATSDVWWSGQLLGTAFESTMSLFTNGSATYCTTQQEDNGVLESLLRAHNARLADFTRIISIRTASDFDRQGGNMSAADNLFNGQNAGYDPAVRNIGIAGIKVVQGILDGWNDTFAKGVPPQNYVGDVLGTLGGVPSFGPGSYFNNTGAPPAPQVGTLVNMATTSNAIMHVRPFPGASKLGYVIAAPLIIGTLFLGA